MKIKAILIPAAFTLGIVVAFAAQPVQAAGCLKGAVVGGAVGHYAGNHAALGAGAGCLIGRHQANKHEREEMRRDTRHDYHDRGYGYGRY